MGWAGNECYRAEISNHHWHAWEEILPLRAAEGEGGPEALLGQEAGDTNTMPSEEAPEEG